MRGAKLDRQSGSDGGGLQSYIAAADESVKPALLAGRGLRDFLGSIDALEPQDMVSIVDQAIVLLESFYVHLPLKRAMHAVDPLQKLRLLRRRLPQFGSEIAFHHEMTQIFTSLRDLHTNYLLPGHFAGMVAFLPFRVEAYFEDGQRHYLMSHTVPGFVHETFVAGVKLTYWNGVPIERAVEIAAAYHAGSNSAARHARGVEGLTKRAMMLTPPPDEEWVTVGYLGPGGEPLEVRVDWTVTGLPTEANASAPAMAMDAAASFGLDLEAETFRQINKMLFAQHVVAEKQKIDNVRESARAQTFVMRAARGLDVAADAGAAEGNIEAAAAETEAVQSAVQGTQSTMPGVFEARPLTIDGRAVSYLRIRTFSVPEDTAFVNEFLRLIELPDMPKDGLIIDVRGNGGGLIWAGERLLQLLTPKTIEPCRLQFINTPVNLALVDAVTDLKSWRPSLRRALETGAAFSAGFPITPPTRCNDIGQRYYGPVVLITDARCYSTTDIFAAGFQDHKIGTILGTDNNTGAGGANVWTLDLIRQFFALGKLPAPLQPLPKGAGMRVAIRRTLRVGDEAGTELEDLGVQPDEAHNLTRKDILEQDGDLLSHAVRILAKRPSCRFVATATRAAERIKVSVQTSGVEYIDLRVDRRPWESRNVKDDQVAFDLSDIDPEFKPPPALVDIELCGYANGQLVCLRRLQA